MVKLISKIFCVLLFITAFSNSQWLQQSSGPSNLLTNVFFADPNTGFATGISGTVLKTTNAGTNWSLNTVTSEHIFGICFLNTSTGFICGAGGFISRTTNTGANWVNQSPPPEYFSSIFFADVNTGYACGLGGVIVKTTNSGTIWARQDFGGTQFLHN